MGKYQAYPKYKDSGVEWLGEIPNHWHSTKIKYGYEITLGKMLQKEAKSSVDELRPYLKAVNIQPFGIYLEQVGKMWFSPAELRNLKLTYGDVLISEGGDVGRSAIWRNELQVCYFQNAINRARPRKNRSPRYLFYWMNTLKSSEFIDILCNKATIAHYTAEKVENSPLFIPSYGEAENIANFLDHETAKIDTLIDKQQQLIQLLKEKRQAVISHAVTKGLNPSAPMRDSGVEWLGEVPEHWVMLKGAYIGRLFGSESVSENDVKSSGDVPFIKVSTLSLNDFQLGDMEFYLDTKTGKSYSTRNNYIVFPKRGAAIFTNKVNIVTVDSVIDPNLMGWEIGNKARVEFIAYLLKLRGLEDIADVSTVPQINNKHIEPIKFPIPPLLEQDEIIKHLGVSGNFFSNLIKRAKLAIELSKERRTALISAAVTGKIDVRQHVSRPAGNDTNG